MWLKRIMISASVATTFATSAISQEIPDNLAEIISQMGDIRTAINSLSEEEMETVMQGFACMMLGDSFEEVAKNEDLSTMTKATITSALASQMREAGCLGTPGLE